MAPQKDNISSFLIAFSFCCRLTAKRDCNYDKWMWNRFKTIRSHGNEISQFAYEAMSKLISRNRSQLTCDQVQGSPQPNFRAGLPSFQTFRYHFCLHADLGLLLQRRPSVSRRTTSYCLANCSSSASDSFSISINSLCALPMARITSSNFKWMARASRFCVFWIRKTMRKVTIVVPVLIISCQVSE